MKEVSITDHFVENDEGVLVKDEYCRTANITVIFGIHVPFSQGGNACHEVFTNVVDCLTFSSDLNIIESRCEHIVSDRNTEALVMDATIQLVADFCPAEEVNNNFHSFRDKELLCGSHIRNNEIHITQKEREGWSNRFEIGEYLGTGTASQTVSLGYKPDFLVVFPSNGMPFYYDATGQKLNFSCAFANGTDSSYGLTISSNGFRVLNGSNHAYGSNIPTLNSVGSTYSYFAIKPI